MHTYTTSVVSIIAVDKAQSFSSFPSKAPLSKATRSNVKSWQQEEGGDPDREEAFVRQLMQDDADGKIRDNSLYMQTIGASSLVLQKRSFSCDGSLHRHS